MAIKPAFLLLAVVGTVLPVLFFVRFFLAEGANANFIGALFVNGAAGGFTVDLLISSVAFWLLAFAEARRLGMPKPWLYIALNLFIGLSLALPLFLYSRTRFVDSRG